MMLRALARGVQGWTPSLSILIFHRVLSQPDPLFPQEPDGRRFEEILRAVASCFTVMPLSQAAACLAEGRLPPSSLCITFDDGYADNESIAAPILQRLGMHATFFVATGFLDGGRMWNDTVIEAIRRTKRSTIELDDLGLGSLPLDTLSQRRAAIDRILPRVKHMHPSERQMAVDGIAARADVPLPDDLMMTTSQLRALHRRGMGIGGHTLTHPILCSTSDEEARTEIHAGRDDLQDRIQAPVELFAYPNGKPDADYSARHAAMARRAGYLAAVTTAPGSARVGDDPMQLPRFTPWDQDLLRFNLRLIRNLRARQRRANA